MNARAIQERPPLEPDSRLHQKIRRLWVEQSLAEDMRDLDGLISMTDIVIGQQGVFEVADVTDTHQGPWASIPPEGKPLKVKVPIYFRGIQRQKNLMARKSILIGKSC